MFGQSRERGVLMRRKFPDEPNHWATTSYTLIFGNKRN